MTDELERWIAAGWRYAQAEELIDLEGFDQILTQLAAAGRDGDFRRIDSLLKQLRAFHRGEF